MDSASSESADGTGPSCHSGWLNFSRGFILEDTSERRALLLALIESTFPPAGATANSSNSQNGKKKKGKNTARAAIRSNEYGERMLTDRTICITIKGLMHNRNGKQHKCKFSHCLSRQYNKHWLFIPFWPSAEETSIVITCVRSQRCDPR